MGSRRKFLEHISWFGIGSQIDFSKLHPELKFDGNNWNKIRDAFAVSRNEIINFNSGSAGNMPDPVYNSLVRNTKMFNSFAPYEILKEHSEKLDILKSRLANVISCASNEIALTRNTTESINSVIWGLPLEFGDEIIIAKSDYPNAVNTIKSRAKKDGLNLKELDLDLNSSDDAIFEQYKNAIGPSTKLILVTFITHREGQILPAKKICAYAKSKGVEVILDAAHAYGHIEHNVKDIGCDYYATSLHKWLNAPLGSGLLYVSKEKVAKLIPHNASPPVGSMDDMHKFEFLGTHDYPRVISILAALDFLELTGIEAKQNRLNYLKHYWASELKKIEHIEIVTDLERSCAVASFRFLKQPATPPMAAYRNKYGIHLKSTGYPGKGFARVSTNLFINKTDLDRFINATKAIMSS